MDSELDYAILSSDCLRAEKLLRQFANIGREQSDKALCMAALSKSMQMLELVHGYLEPRLNRSHAFAYALNQGFADGVLFLYAKGALRDAESWIQRSKEYKRYLMRYLYMKGRLFVDVGTDFFGYILRVYSLENMLGARGVELADNQDRADALHALAKAGAIDEELFREYALRALLFDKCELIDALCDGGGFDFAHVFSSEPMSLKNYLVHPDMSPRKVELVASIMPADYRFPLNPHYLTSVDTVRAIVPLASSDTCVRPDELVAYLIANGCNSELAMVQEWGGIVQDNVEKLLDLAHTCENNRAVALLMEYKNRHFETNPFSELDGGCL